MIRKCSDLVDQPVLIGRAVALHSHDPARVQRTGEPAKTILRRQQGDIETALTVQREKIFQVAWVEGDHLNTVRPVCEQRNQAWLAGHHYFSIGKSRT